MELDVLGLFSACSYALDCVEAELVHVTSKHAKRVAYMSVCVAEQMGIQGKELQDLAVCALLHDNALTQYIQEELHNDIARASAAQEFPRLGAHCSMGEHNIQGLPFHTDVTNVILYHHENADGTGPFGKKWEETPLFARIIHLCDLLDVACRTQTFTTATWEKGLDFLQKAKGRMFDAECVNAFLKSFSEAHFLSLGSRDLDACLWNKVPRIRQELTFSQIKVLADFFAHIVDYKWYICWCGYKNITWHGKYSAYTEKRGKYMLTENQIKLTIGSLLHDIGKVAVGNEILEKPGRLTDEEFTTMKDHASYTYYILSEIDGFEELRDWAAFHHERLDGTGYPFGKTAADLNTQERMMACVDIYQALTESRPYKQGMSHEKACGILKDMADKGWIDAEIVSQVDSCFRI